MEKSTIHIIQSSHTDLGYTHRQEYVYRAHARYLDHAVKMAKENEDFKYSLENFWMYENYCRANGPGKVSELNQFIKRGNIEITANYLNLLNIMDEKAFASKVKKVTTLFPNVKVAVQQDVNSVSKNQALALYENGIKYIYISIHTHHGMFAGKGKQRGFVWNLGGNKQIIVWAGEHYMLGNELGIHMDVPPRYVFKDDINLVANDPSTIGATRLKSYLELLNNEGYDQKHIPVVVSGSVTDNAPPSIKTLAGVAQLQAKVKDSCEIKLSSFANFFKKLELTKLPELTGEWPSWWTDGAISTPEAVRQYREAQIIYQNLKAVRGGGPVFKQKLQKLEHYLLLFSEHTWGGWASQARPFANGTNLLLSRKKAFATQASAVAWQLWDEVKEKEGYNIVKINPTNQVVVKNIHGQRLEKLLAIGMPRQFRHKATKDRFVESEDVLEIRDENNQKYDYVITQKMGASDNLNTSIESDDIILLNVRLGPYQKITLFLKTKEYVYKPRTSSLRAIGVDNQDDVLLNETRWCRYNQNGIENKYYKIVWNERGIASVYDKEQNAEMIAGGKYFHFIRILSDDSRDHLHLALNLQI